MYETLSLTLEDAVARLRFERPDAHNAFNDTMHREFSEALHALRKSLDVRAIVLEASGPSFIGGGDFEYLRQIRDDPDIRRRSQREAFDTFTLLNEISVPIIAAVHGAALGFGATIVTSCDMVVAWEGARFADPHVRAGIVAGDGGILSWAAAAGHTRAKRYLLTGDPITARDAYDFGLVTDLVSTPEEAVPAALALAHKVAALPPMAVQGTKRTFNALSRHRNGGILDVSLLTEMASLMSEDLEEALLAATEKRKGDFKNR
jgi:enoyl-CoA hydratase